MYAAFVVYMLCVGVVAYAAVGSAVCCASVSRWVLKECGCMRMAVLYADGLLVTLVLTSDVCNVDNTVMPAARLLK